MRRPTFPPLHRLIPALVASLLFSACHSASKLAKASAPRPSPFLVNADSLKPPADKKQAFLRQWRGGEPAHWDLVLEQRRIHVAPVELGHLRAATRSLSKVACPDSVRRSQARKWSKDLHERIIAALVADKPAWTILDQPQSGALLLELALVEFNPNPIIGGIARKGINIALWPGAEAAVSHKLKGSVAIEGRMRLGPDGPILYEFSDAEQVRSGLILNYHDYTHFSFSQKLASEWTKQILRCILQRAEGQNPDSLAATLRLW